MPACSRQNRSVYICLYIRSLRTVLSEERALGLRKIEPSRRPGRFLKREFGMDKPGWEEAEQAQSPCLPVVEPGKTPWLGCRLCKGLGCLRVVSTLEMREVMTTAVCKLWPSLDVKEGLGRKGQGAAAGGKGGVGQHDDGEKGSGKHFPRPPLHGLWACSRSLCWDHIFWALTWPSQFLILEPGVRAG